MTPHIEYFDDPLNPRGWVLEPDRRRLEASFPDLDWQVRPVGMVESWESYDGPEVPGGLSGMAATCARLSERSGMPIDEYLWFEDPPTSSWPACLAIAAAGLDGGAAGLRALRACREATFVRRRKISDEDALRGALEGVDLDVEDLLEAVADGRAEAAFEDHRTAAETLDVRGARTADGRCELPTLAIRGDDGRAVSGLSSYGAYRDAVTAATGREPTATTITVADALERYSPEGWVSRAELSALTGDEAVLERARDLVEEGRAVEETFASEPFWRLADDA